MKIKARSFISTISVLLILLMMLATEGNARKISNKLPVPKKQYELINKSSEICLLQADDSAQVLSQIIISSYDKPADALREVVFIKNNTPSRLSSVELSVSYFVDAQVIHKRIVTLPCNIPPHETRMADYKSWDLQKSYCYKGSRHPKKRPVKYYDVKIKLQKACFIESETVD